MIPGKRDWWKVWNMGGALIGILFIIATIGLLLWWIPAQQVAGLRATAVVYTATPQIPSTSSPSFTALQVAQQENEARRTLAQIFAGFGILVTFWIGLRNLGLSQENLRIAQEGQITDRYTKAVEQLGATDDAGKPRLEVRLGGIYALQRIARDSERDHWPVIQTLVAYIRKNAPVQPTNIKHLEDLFSEGKQNQAVREYNLPMDVEAIIQVLRERDRYFGAGELRSPELTHCNLQGAQFFDVHEVHFEWANFSFSNLDGARLEFVKLSHANFFRASLQVAQLSGADLQEAKLIESDLLGANLALANLQGTDFTRANLKYADFTLAQLDGAKLHAAVILTNALLYGVRGLSAEQLRVCEERGALTQGPPRTAPIPNAYHFT